MSVRNCIIALTTLASAIVWGADAPARALNPDGFRKLDGAEIKRLFSDLHLANYPDDISGYTDIEWAMTFNANGTFDGNAFSTGDNGYGTWRVEGDRQCVRVDTVHYQNFGEGAEPLSGCFAVFVNQKSATVAFGHPRETDEFIIVASGVYGAVARVAPTALPRPAPEQKALAANPPEEKPAPPPSQAPSPTPQDDRQVALERERRAGAARLEEMRHKLERERVKQELALQRQKIELQRRAMILQHQKRGLGVPVDMAPPVIRTPDRLTTKQATFTLQGVVSDDNPVIRVEVNGNAVQFGSKDGRFAAEVPVEIGTNEIAVAAFDVDGNRAERRVFVTRERNIPDIEFGRYQALVIGINDYDKLPKLKTAVADATAVADTLEDKYGFSVRRLINPSRDDIIDAFDELREALTERDNLLIYYAGHGWQDPQSNRGYWLPVDASRDRRSRWLANSRLTDTLKAVFAKHVLVVADSCYSGTLTRSIKVPDRRDDYVAHIAEKRARVVLSSGGLEPVIDSGGGDHSVFAAQFLKALEENEDVIDGTKLFERIRHNVVLNAQQTPEYSDIRFAGHEGGDFLFVRRD